MELPPQTEELVANIAPVSITRRPILLFRSER
jgi:hypothetical protein